jgi:hypothetical protein
MKIEKAKKYDISTAQQLHKICLILKLMKCQFLSQKNTDDFLDHTVLQRATHVTQFPYCCDLHMAPGLWVELKSMWKPEIFWEYPQTILCL